MKQNHLLILIIFLFAQGLLAQPFELSEQTGVRSQFTDGIWLNDSSFVVSEVTEFFPFTTISQLKAYHVSGELLWESESDSEGEVTRFLTIELSGDTAIAVGANRFEACDFGLWSYNILIYNLNGELIEEILVGWPEQNNLSVLPWGYAANSNDSLFHFSATGELLEEYVIEDIEGVFAFGDNVLVKGNGFLVRISPQGNIVDTLEIWAADDFAVNTDRIVLLYDDYSVQSVNEEFELIDEVQLDPLSGNYGVMNDGNGFAVYDDQSFTYLNADLDVLNSVEVSFVSDFDPVKISLGSDFCVIVGANFFYSGGFFTSPYYHSVLYTISRSGDGLPHGPDLEITAVEEWNISLDSPEEVIVYYQGSVMVTVRNSGDVGMEGFYLTHNNGIGSCVPDIGKIYYDIQLDPGEETTVFFNPIDSWFFSEEGVTNFDICVSVSCQGAVIDRNEPNDEGCLDYTVGIDDLVGSTTAFVKLYPNPTSEILNIETDAIWTGFRIHDISGKLVKHGRINRNYLNVSDLEKGMYIIDFYNDKEVFASKVIIQ